MNFWDLLLIGIGLSMDAFAVSICKGLKMQKINYRHTVIIGLFFGGFQAIMPVIGWALGKQFSKYIESFDHWVAFVLLALIGGNMLREALTEKDDEDDEKSAEKLDIKELFLLAVATSIDALAVGVTFAFLKVSIGKAVSIIGLTTFILSVIGVAIGNRFGAKYKNKAEIAGGAILIIIGLKILLEGLGIISF